MLACILETLVKEVGRRARSRGVAEVESVVAGVGGCVMKMVVLLLLLLLLIVEARDVLVRLRELRPGC